jgi:hypothetical protein
MHSMFSVIFLDCLVNFYLGLFTVQLVVNNMTFSIHKTLFYVPILILAGQVVYVISPAQTVDYSLGQIVTPP